MQTDFHPVVQEWFETQFAAPTPAQAEGWPAIASGRHTLISAPTGSGKTLAAFLICIDRLFRAALGGGLQDRAQVVYVSPLKALSNDVHKNLSLPLEQIRDLASQRGLLVPEIRVALRTGDTPASERQLTARKPPHIWITTPESLYILLTSDSGRRGLGGVRTLILDEIHAVADDKRGSHLSLSVERLVDLTEHRITRIGLSATQKPIEEVARFLVGNDHIGANGKPDCRIVDTGHRRAIELREEIPKDELGPIATHEIWDETVVRIAELIEAHRTTLVFVNTRRLVERVAHQLSQKIGEELVVAHHGSLSKDTRLRAENRLKNAEVKVCVATASLELGIDVGAVELVCQIGSPRSIGVLLQRVGRSGHWLGGVPKGRLFPLTRDELIECAALLHAVRTGDLDRLVIPQWPLDILSQQIVAMCGVGEWGIEELFRLVRRAYPYRDLPREKFDEVLEMLSEGISKKLGYRSAHLHRDRIHGKLKGRRGARLAALTSGGAIPDNADYRVVSDPEGTYVGSVNEDFAIESLAGDIFLLGNTAWRVRRVEKGRMRVEDARGEAPTIPFWLGEAPARTKELSNHVSLLREEIDERLGSPQECMDWLIQEAGLSGGGAEQAREYVAEGKRVLGAVPTLHRIIAERFFDESGGMQLVIHSPLGAAINRAWGLALRKRFCRSFNLELQASANDDGINISLAPQHSFPLEDVFQFCKSRNVRDTLIQAVLPAPTFTTRWRWTLTRSLALLRFRGGKRVAPPIQRMQADDMLAAVFPEQAQCQDNRDSGDVQIPDHPLVFETLRDCLTEALDVEGLREVLESLERGEIQFQARDTSMPSAFSHQILNAMPYAFLDDAPLEERRARAVILRRSLPQHADELGQLSPEAIQGASEDAWPAVRDAEELHDALLSLVVFPEKEKARLPQAASGWLDSLRADNRAVRLASERRDSGDSRESGCYWVAAERLALARETPLALRMDQQAKETLAAMKMLDGRGDLGGPDAEDGEEPMKTLVRGWMQVSGPLTAAGLAETLGAQEEDIRIALGQLEGDGSVLRGSFTGPGHSEEFCDRRILARIHRATLVRLRREIEPVSASTFLRFLFSWQHLSNQNQCNGDHGVLEVVEQLQGFETAAAAWEDEILKSRVRDYEPGFLDNLCLAGEVVWGRWARRETQANVPARRPGVHRSAVLGLGLRESMSWLLQPATPDENALSIPARAVLAFLRERGASFFPEIRSGTKHLPAEIEEALWQLVAAGFVTADSFAALRSLVNGDNRRSGTHRHRLKSRTTREGRWSLLQSVGSPDSSGDDNRVELRVCQYLRRYGVMCREMMTREASTAPWREIIQILRRMEARGEIRGGRFIAGFPGEHFALPEAVDALRSTRRSPQEGQWLRISACDPLNLVGILTPGKRVSAVPGNRVIFRDGVAVAAVESGTTRILTRVEDDARGALERLLDQRPSEALDPSRVRSLRSRRSSES